MGLEDIINKSDNDMKYVITSAQYGAKVNEKAFDTLKYYADFNEAELIVLPVEGYMPDLEIGIDESIDDKYILNKNKKLNNSVNVAHFGVKAQNIQPMTSVARFATKDGTTIFGSPKQWLEVVANKHDKKPKMMMTTGVVTYPHYSNSKLGTIATKDHKYGAIFVDTVDNTNYIIRHLPMLKNGKLTDLCISYDGNKEPEIITPEALVLGDLHIGELDKKMYNKSLDMIINYQPKKVFLHDVFDGHSVSHHDNGRLVTTTRKSKQHIVNLEQELNNVRKTLNSMSELNNTTQYYVVKSNHDEFLDKYIEDSRFMKDPTNSYIASQILTGMIAGNDALQYGLNLTGNINSNIHFLSRDDFMAIQGYVLSEHGDKGSNGARGSWRSYEKAYGKMITAHTHTSKQIRDMITVGANCKLQQEYNKAGISSWTHSNAFVYPNGLSQLIPVINYKI